MLEHSRRNGVVRADASREVKDPEDIVIGHQDREWE